MTESRGLGQDWKTSTRTQNNGQCVEARFHDGMVEIRDTKDREGPSLFVKPAAWLDFVTDIKAGMLDL